jgi:putative ABC transport system permease protein
VATQVLARLVPADGPFSSPPVLAPFTIAVIVGSLVVVGIVAGMAPAIRASRIPPAEALRA